MVHLLHRLYGVDAPAIATHLHEVSGDADELDCTHVQVTSALMLKLHCLDSPWIRRTTCCNAMVAHKCRPSSEDQAHHTHTTTTPHYILKCTVVSHHEKSSVCVWLQYNTIQYKVVKRHVAVVSEALANRTVKKHRRRRTNVL